MNVDLDAEPRITLNEVRYLKHIYRRQNEELTRIGTKTVSSFMGVQPSTVTEMFQNLAEKRLLKYARYHGVDLTEKGIVEARKILRKHRLLEVLFVRLLNYDVQGACEEAARLDHHVSGALANAICRLYGHPDTCPCNKDIFREGGCCGTQPTE